MSETTIENPTEEPNLENPTEEAESNTKKARKELGLLARLQLSLLTWLPFIVLIVVIFAKLAKGDRSRPEFVPVMVIGGVVAVVALALCMMGTMSLFKGRVQPAVTLLGYIVMTAGVLVLSGSNAGNYRCD